MRTRIMTGVLMAIGVVLLLLYLPKIVVLLCLAGVTGACFLELAHLIEVPETNALKQVPVWVMLVCLWSGWGLWAGNRPELAMSVMFLGIISIWIFYFRDATEMQAAVARIQGLIFAAVYVQLLWVPMSALIGLESRGFLFLLLATTHAADAAAYFAGTRFGKTPFFPIISPKKTWEGWAGGVLGSAVAGVVCAQLFPLGLALWQVILLSSALGVAASFGDLAESMLKRSRGVKDSGNWIPGHGGILDRVDGLFFSAPVLYFFVVMRQLLS